MDVRLGDRWREGRDEVRCEVRGWMASSSLSRAAPGAGVCALVRRQRLSIDPVRFTEDCESLYSIKKGVGME
jgi:hypothetical protein